MEVKEEDFQWLAEWIEYNKHRCGELGEFIRPEYVHNGIKMMQERILIKSKGAEEDNGNDEK